MKEFNTHISKLKYTRRSKPTEINWTSLSTVIIIKSKRVPGAKLSAMSFRSMEEWWHSCTDS
jgi:hypothetical protein